MTITMELDRALRKYAQYLDSLDGEDAYHNALVSLLQKPVSGVREPEHFLKVAIKRALYSLYHNEGEEQRARGWSRLNWHPSDRGPQDVCKRGHPLRQRTSNKQKICLMCKRMREATRP